LYGQKSSLSLRSDNFRLKMFNILIQTYIAHASDDVFRNLKRRFSPNAFKEEHINIKKTETYYLYCPEP
jgi:hypothetical protein